MTDIELIQQEIDKLQRYIDEGRHSGNTYREVTQYIYRFFDEPAKTEILINTMEMSNQVKERLQHDFPDYEFALNSYRQDIYILKRITPTFKELALEHIEKWQNKIKELESENV